MKIPKEGLDTIDRIAAQKGQSNSIQEEAEIQKRGITGTRATDAMTKVDKP